MEKLILIDGNALLHRAYHAYPPLTNAKGEMVNAVYGFFTMVLNLIVQEKPDYFITCFDRSKPTIRQSMYAGYHAHRPQMEDGLSSQIALIDELLGRMGVTIFAVDGYEGDDMIGTIATQVQRGKGRVAARSSDQLDKVQSEEIETIIVTGDRDMLQLVNSHTKVLMPIVGVTKSIVYDESRVEEKYGVTPAQFIDYKALIGDASDGYPGVTGIGPKTAAKLLQQYGSFEALYTRIGELPEKTGLMLATDAEQAALAKKLAAIVTDAPIRLDITKCACRDFDYASLREGFLNHGFQSLVNRLDSKFTVVPKKKVEKKKSDDQLELL